MQRLICSLLLLLLMGACRSNEPTEFTGTFTEAEMQTVTVAPAKGAAVTFSTEGAELIGFENLVPGTPVRVIYLGRIRKEGPTAALRVEADSRYALLCGRWIECGDDADGFGMGFELAPKGVAYSIGMQRVVFKQWRLTSEGGLWLDGHILGNGQTIPFAEEWEIRSLGDGRLTLCQEEMQLQFRHETEADLLLRKEREAQAAETHVPKSLSNKQKSK